MIYSKTLSPFLIPSICLTLLSILLWKWFHGRRHKMALLSSIPGPKTIPFLGNVLDYVLPPLELMNFVVKEGLRWQKQSPIMLVWLLQKPQVNILTPETAQGLLSSNININKSIYYEVVQPWLGTGLVTSAGNKWHSHRKMLTPTFHFKILGDFLGVMNEQARIFVDHLRKHIDETAFNIYPYITRCTLDIICETAMGCNINAQGNVDLEFPKTVERISTMMVQRMFKPWIPILAKYWPTKERKEYEKCLGVLHGFTGNIVNQRRKEHSQSKLEDDLIKNVDHIGQKKRFAFLDHLLEISKSEELLTEEDIREEVDTFMFAGHDTTASAIGWVLYLIGRDCEVQARIHTELDEVFGEDKDRSTTMEDLRKMQYLECCIKEALRLFPPVPFFSRNLDKDLVCDKYTIPADTIVQVMPFLIHRDPNHWPDPEVYNPDRFSIENCTNRHPFAFIPFSAGPRNCIGQKFAMMEIKTILITVLRNYTVKSVVSRENLKIIGDLILKSEDGILMKLHHK